MPINLTNVSPSSVGDYAICSQKLVYDSTYGRPFSSSMYADYGTVCHYFTQYQLGLNPKKQPDENTIMSARRLPEFVGQSENVFFDAVNACAVKAISALPTLPKDIYWIPEFEAADPSLLPGRLSRSSGKVKGFSGDVDLLRSDRQELIDLKFVSKLPTKCKSTYLWQMGSYHLITGVPKTTLVFITRDARYAATLELNWQYPKFAEFAQQMRRVVAKMGHADFEQYAFPVLGDNCEWCDHKNRCPLQGLPSVDQHHKRQTVIPVDHSFTHMLNAAAAGKLL